MSNGEQGSEVAAWAARTGELVGSDLEPYFAPFLMQGGMGEDRFEIERVKIDGRTLEAKCRMASYFKAPFDIEFHLNAVTGMALVTQLGMVHGMFLAGVSKKDFEILMMDYQTTLARLIRDPEDIRVRMTALGRTLVPAGWRRKHPRTYFKWTFELNDGSWIGAFALAFPFGPNGQR